MSAAEQQRAEWLDPAFWDRLDRLESRHRHAQTKYEVAQRSLERLTPHEVEELRSAWKTYCEVIAELDSATAEIETLRS
jgi:hypothetical protein